MLGVKDIQVKFMRVLKLTLGIFRLKCLTKTETMSAVSECTCFLSLSRYYQMPADLRKAKSFCNSFQNAGSLTEVNVTSNKNNKKVFNLRLLMISDLM